MVATDRAIPAAEEDIAALVEAEPPLSAEQRDKLAVLLRGRDAFAVASAGKRHRPISSISAAAFVSARWMLGTEGQDGPGDRFDRRADADSR